MNKKRLFLFLIFFSGLGFAQEKSPYSASRFSYAFSPGIIQQRNTFLEANLFAGKIMTDFDGKVPSVGVMGFRVGVETDCHRTIAPKIGYEIALLAVTVRLSAANYYQNEKSEFRLIPEFGFCLGGWVNLTYGSGISLNNGHLTDIGHHRVSLSFNLNQRLGEATHELMRKP